MAAIRGSARDLALGLLLGAAYFYFGSPLSIAFAVGSAIMVVSAASRLLMLRSAIGLARGLSVEVTDEGMRMLSITDGECLEVLYPWSSLRLRDVRTGRDGAIARVDLIDTSMGRSNSIRLERYSRMEVLANEIRTRLAA